jgi:hypothetical protein
MRASSRLVAVVFVAWAATYKQQDSLAIQDGQQRLEDVVHIPRKAVLVSFLSIPEGYQRWLELYEMLPAELFEIVSSIALLAALWSREYRKVAPTTEVTTTETFGSLVGAIVMMGGVLYSIVHFPYVARYALQGCMVFGISSAVGLLFEPFLDMQTDWKSAVVHGGGFLIGITWMWAVYNNWMVVEINESIVILLGVVMGGVIATDSFEVLSIGLWLFFCYDYYWTIMSSVPPSMQHSGQVRQRLCCVSALTIPDQSTCDVTPP